MTKQKNRPKHMLHRTWFSIVIDGVRRVVRPVNGEDWYGVPGLSHGVVHLVDENSELVGVVEVGYFDRMATRLSSEE